MPRAAQDRAVAAGRSDNHFVRQPPPRVRDRGNGRGIGQRGVPSSGLSVFASIREKKMSIERYNVQSVPEWTRPRLTRAARRRERWAFV